MMDIQNNIDITSHDIVTNLLNNTKIINNDPTKKKRGRPKKNKIAIECNDSKKKIRNINPVERCDDEIILHIPLTIDDIKKYSPEITLDNTVQNNLTSESKNIFVINENSYNEQNSENSENIKKLNNLLNEKDEYIKKLENDLIQIKQMNNIKDGIDDINITKMNINFVNVKDGKTIMMDKTDILCWWCTESFNTMPCFIPEKVVKNTYYVYGCFCSFNCAIAYNLQMNDYKVWDKHSLIISLCNEMTQSDNDISIAPPKEILKKYGGYLTIEEYRRNFKNMTKEYRILIPPMISIISYIEETSKCNDKIKIQKSNNNGYALKRTKPLPGSNTNITKFIK
jgi:hypothetical protein